MRATTRRTLEHLELQLAVDRLQLCRARRQLRTSLRRAAGHPLSLLSAFAAGALITTGALRVGRARSAERPAPSSSKAHDRTFGRLVRLVLRSGSVPALRGLLSLAGATVSTSGPVAESVAGTIGIARGDER